MSIPLFPSHIPFLSFAWGQAKACLLKKRKGKALAQSSSEVPRFKTPFHEAHFKGKLSARKVLPEVAIDYNDDILSPCAIQIKMRKWEKFTAPLQAVGHNLVKEFYANAWEPDKAKRKPYTYTTMVQGNDISFAPKDIKRVLKLRKDPLPNVASYHERKANKDYRLEESFIPRGNDTHFTVVLLVRFGALAEIRAYQEVQECLCLEGREWVRHKDGRPHYLRRNDLEPMAKGWYDFVCRSFLPTTNRSELTVERVVLIHSIIIGENINVEEIIADQFYKFVYKTDLSSSLPFLSIIAALCLDAKITTLMGDTLINQEIYRRLDSQQEESRKSFEAINTRMDRMDDQLSFLCYSNQMSNEQMPVPYQNTARQFREMVMQGIPVTMANLAIHRQKEEDMNQERMRYDQILQEAAAQQAREANKGKAREVVPDSEEEDSEELASSASEEW
ncbi:hypothetical protein PIB30_060151 [Stylosanthes scabra]|uniref:Putative plant transposon protein domain-containing protein n=1 Tax=Stylosanthes scabra TaxID=79078 RepID=A0ABU6TK86_9FABA|nr:hypothetical protein [Stylosanthes scabra]